MNEVKDYNYKQIFVKTIILFVSVFLLLFSMVPSTTAHENAPQVIGGQDADPGEWPWMAALVLAPIESAYDGHFCGATLVAPDWVLTAGHCVADLEARHIDVVLGRQNLMSDEGERIRVIQKLVHPAYDPSTLDSDLALLQLERPSLQQPVQLNNTDSPNLNMLSDAPIMTTVTGWGNTSIDATNYPTTLQEIELPLVDRQICNSPEAYNGDITLNMICAGYQQGGEDSCKGDSGGPLMIFDEQQETWMQSGVVSWGEGCAQPNHYGVYTNLPNFYEWIEANSMTHATQTIFLPIIFNE